MATSDLEVEARSEACLVDDVQQRILHTMGFNGAKYLSGALLQPSKFLEGCLNIILGRSLVKAVEHNLQKATHTFASS